jgi:hypothetical protein
VVMPPSRHIACTCSYFGLAYRRSTVKATCASIFAAKIRSGKHAAGVIVLPLPIG